MKCMPFCMYICWYYFKFCTVHRCISILRLDYFFFFFFITTDERERFIYHSIVFMISSCFLTSNTSKLVVYSLYVFYKFITYFVWKLLRSKLLLYYIINAAKYSPHMHIYNEIYLLYWNNFFNNGLLRYIDVGLKTRVNSPTSLLKIFVNGVLNLVYSVLNE